MAERLEEALETLRGHSAVAAAEGLPGWISPFGSRMGGYDEGEEKEIFEGGRDDGEVYNPHSRWGLSGSGDHRRARGRRRRVRPALF